MRRALKALRGLVGFLLMPLALVVFGVAILIGMSVDIGNAVMDAIERSLGRGVRPS